MTSTPASQRLRKNLSLKTYLEELSALKGCPVAACDLCTVDRTDAIQRELSKRARCNIVLHAMSFSDKRSDRFRDFVRNLHAANPSAVFLWTPRTRDCGVLQVSSISEVDFGFAVNINGEGILSFVTADLDDRMLLDFTTAGIGEPQLLVELQGSHWPTVSY